MSGGGKGGGSQTVGFKYFFGIHMGICRGPVNELIQVRVGDRNAWFGSVTENETVQIDAEDLFGGKKKEGGVKGPMTVMMGGPTQVAPSDMTSVFGSPQPGHRGKLTIYFDGLISMMNPYPKPWKFRVRRSTAGWDGDPWYPEKAMITYGTEVPIPEIEEGATEPPTLATAWSSGKLGSIYSQMFITLMLKLNKSAEEANAIIPDQLSVKGMNGAHIIYECLTNRLWGRGHPREKLDDASFRAAANQLYAEGFGLCLKWSRRDSITNFVRVVLDHIGGVLFVDRQTGLLKLKLIRNDYTVSSLPMFDAESGLLSVNENVVSTVGKVINAVQVTYRDPITDEVGTVSVRNPAAVQAAGGIVNQATKSYPGIPTADMALRVAQRDLRAASVTLRRFKLTMDRRGYTVQPGDAIRIQDLSRNIRDTVVRVVETDVGNVTDGKIKFTVVQDVFALPASSFTGNQTSMWVAPTTRPCLGQHKVFEAPYFMLARRMSAADFNAIEEGNGYIATVVDEGQPLNANYEIAVRPSAPTVEDEPLNNGYYCGYVP